ncbi:MAG: archaetidylserine decarboxylase [Spirochaetota bacterium]|nr:archaetidylserine decarboxylase [Spirochaetota bacterium]
MNISVKLIVFKILPARLLSRLFGYCTRIPLPAFIMKKLISWYSKKFNVALDEAFIPPGGFKNFDEFFTRNLKRGMRSVQPHPLALVSPVDAMVSACGNINAGQLIQAKGIKYDVASLLPGQFQSQFISGSFITLYLSPGDYHRIHSPVSGTIVGYQYDPGKLYTVQDWLVKMLPGLFTVNERITSYIQSAFGLVAVCKVGAMNVGRISLSYAPVFTNHCFAKPYFYRFDETRRPKVSKGDELGIFHLGSTVIVVTQKPVSFVPNIECTRVQMGQVLGYF